MVEKSNETIVFAHKNELSQMNLTLFDNNLL